MSADTPRKPPTAPILNPTTISTPQTHLGTPGSGAWGAGLPFFFVDLRTAPGIFCAEGAARRVGAGSRSLKSSSTSSTGSDLRAGTLTAPPHSGQRTALPAALSGACRDLPQSHWTRTGIEGLPCGRQESHGCGVCEREV